MNKKAVRQKARAQFDIHNKHSWLVALRAICMRVRGERGGGERESTRSEGEAEKESGGGRQRGRETTFK